MKNWMIFMLVAIWACGEKGDDFGSPDQLILLSDREVICSGQTATLRLYSTQSRKEVSIADFTFDPLPNGLGSINSGGVFTLGAVPSSSEATISGTYKSKIKLSTKIRLQTPSSNSISTLSVSSVAFLNRDSGRPIHFWADGSSVMGTAKFSAPTLKSFEIIKYSNQGEIQWKKELGSGEAQFIQVIESRIYAAGTLNEIGGAVFFILVVFDLEGNLIWEKRIPFTPQLFLKGFDIDSNGNFYLSTYTNGDAYVTSLEKYNSMGEEVWKVSPGTAYSEFYFFPSGSFAVKSIEGLGMEPFLTFYDENGKLIRKERIDFTESGFIGSNGTIGSGYQVQNQSNETTSILFDLYANTGIKTAVRQVLVRDQSYSGTLINPVEKKKAPAGFTKFFTSKNGDIHVFHAGFWGNYDFLILNSSSGKEWAWWKENKARTAEGVLFPLKITEDENNLILFAESDGKLYRFSLGKDYSFNDCLRESFWNKLEMF